MTQAIQAAQHPGVTAIVMHSRFPYYRCTWASPGVAHCGETQAAMRNTGESGENPELSRNGKANRPPARSPDGLTSSKPECPSRPGDAGHLDCLVCPSSSR